MGGGIKTDHIKINLISKIKDIRVTNQFNSTYLFSFKYKHICSYYIYSVCTGR